MEFKYMWITKAFSNLQPLHKSKGKPQTFILIDPWGKQALCQIVYQLNLDATIYLGCNCEYDNLLVTFHNRGNVVIKPFFTCAGAGYNSPRPPSRPFGAPQNCHWEAVVRIWQLAIVLPELLFSELLCNVCNFLLWFVAFYLVPLSISMAQHPLPPPDHR